MSVKDQPKLINAADLAAHIGVDVRTIWRWVRQRKIPAIRRGTRCLRFNLADVLAELEVPTDAN